MPDALLHLPEHRGAKCVRPHMPAAARSLCTQPEEETTWNSHTASRVSRCSREKEEPTTTRSKSEKRRNRRAASDTDTKKIKSYYHLKSATHEEECTKELEL